MGNILHFLIILWPLLTDSIIKHTCGATNLVPILLASESEELGVESDASPDVLFCCSAMLETDLELSV